MAASGREALDRWRAARPKSLYDATPDLARALRHRMGPEALGALEPSLRAFGETVAQVVDPAAAVLEREGPVLDGQEVRFHPARDEAGRAVWASGILAAGAFEQAALFHLLAHAGEAGQACPVACTAGLIRALRAYGSRELQERFLPPLLDPDFDRCERGAQFLTEIQGGSDVGANLTRAVPDGSAWRISGEKWFCSVADAEQFVVTARPEGAPAGTAGIGCLLVPRLVDGRTNGFRIRRLKDKLGTRALATGEIEFDGALAWPIGELSDGFRIAAGIVLNTSRWLNALGSAGLMRRAYLEAASFAAQREAFGRPIAEFPLVRENLAVLRTEEQAALAATLEVTAVVDSRAADDVAYHRILVNANKFATALAGTHAVRRAIETLGGNGTIEDFSPLPRLYRDAIVFESWEGTHNVLCAQVLRDLGRLGALDLVVERVRGADPRVDAALAELEPRLRESLADPERGALHGRRQIATLVRAVQGACLLREGAPEAVVELHVRRHLVPGWHPETDRHYAGLLEAAVSDEPPAVAASGAYY
ncbi:MAG: acyl-CoA dehydrogenase family protein [Gaiellaceae bacterium]